MTDDPGRRERPKQEFGDDDDPWDDLGEPVFADEPGGEVPLRFGPDETGPLPHWTAPPTGEVPRIFAEKDPTDDVDVWSSFAQQAPVWRESSRDESSATVADIGLADVPRMGAMDERPSDEDPFFDLVEPEAEPEPVPELPKKREPIKIGSDPTGEGTSPTRGRSGARVGGQAPPNGRRDADDSRGAPRPGGPAPRTTRAAPAAGTAGRDMPTAIALGLGLAAVFVLLTKFAGSTGIMALVVAVLGLAAVEFYEKTQERGYRPATVTGVVAAVLIPLAAYWQGERGIVLGLFLATVATMVTMMGFASVESGPLQNAGITLLGVVWIGGMGAFAGLILQAGQDIGTDTIFALVVAVVANDVGALLVGSAGGRTPLRPWISPNKTVEGLIGGAVVTIGAMILLSIANGDATTWIELTDYVFLGVAVAVLAPIGDLTESMFKRNLDIKDFGTVLPGHGGILDRFDGFLFTLPAAYYLLITLEPFIPS